MDGIGLPIAAFLSGSLLLHDLPKEITGQSSGTSGLSRVSPMLFQTRPKPLVPVQLFVDTTLAALVSPFLSSVALLFGSWSTARRAYLR